MLTEGPGWWVRTSAFANPSLRAGCDADSFYRQICYASRKRTSGAVLSQRSDDEPLRRRRVQAWPDDAISCGPSGLAGVITTAESPHDLLRAALCRRRCTAVMPGGPSDRSA